MCVGFVRADFCVLFTTGRGTFLYVALWCCWFVAACSTRGRFTRDIVLFSPCFPCPMIGRIRAIQSVCNKYVCGQHKCGGLQGASTPKGTARARSDSMAADAGATAYDGSYSASSNRTDSNASSVGTQSEAEPSKQGLGDGGGWGNVDMGFAR